MLERVFPPSPVYVATPGDADRITLDFIFTIESEDDGLEPQAVLLEDFGVADGERAYTNVLGTNGLDDGRRSDGPRTGSVRWEEPLNEDQECRRITLLVTHEFLGREPNFFCPLDPNDVGRLSWVVARCRDANAACSVDDCIQSNQTGNSCD